MTAGASSADDFLIVTRSLEVCTETSEELGETLRTLTFKYHQPNFMETFVLNPVARRMTDVDLSVELMWYFDHTEMPATVTRRMVDGCRYPAGEFTVLAMWWDQQETVVVFHVLRRDTLLRRLISHDLARTLWVDLPAVPM